MKIKSVFWFIKRPILLPQAFSIFLRRFYKGKEDTRFKAETWCKAKSIDTLEAVNILFPDHRFIDFFEAKKEIIEQAQLVEQACEVSMGGAGDINLLYNLCLYLRPGKVLETGVAYGWSALAILSAMDVNQRGFLISTDMPYMHINNEPYVGCIIPEKLKNKWALIREADITGLPKALKLFDGEIDICHYDSDKSYTGRKWAYPKLWNALNKGGVFISDDIGDNIAFKEFSEKLNLNPILIAFENKYIGVLVKER